MNAVAPIATDLEALSTELLDIYGSAPTSPAELETWLKDWLYQELHDGLDPRHNFSPVRWELVAVVYALLPAATESELEATFAEKSDSFFRAIEDNTCAWDNILACSARGNEVPWNDRVETYFAKASFPKWAQAEAYAHFAE